mgnify:CR=1 FL=1
MAAEESRTESGKLELKMTSMIDVVFLLLIFFIVTLEVPRPERVIPGRLESPQSSSDEVDPDPPAPAPRVEFEDIWLSIRRDPESGSVETYVQRQRILNHAHLRGKLRRYRRLHEDSRVVVDCEEDVPYRHFVKTISFVRQSGLRMAFSNGS